jgi:MoxR-like ATPase
MPAGPTPSQTTQQSIVPERVLTARERILKVRNVLKSLIIGQDDMINALMLGLISGENVALIGQPGTGKTQAVFILSKLLNAVYYFHQLHKNTPYDELFGPPSIPALIQGRFERVWTPIISSDIVLLDEIFNASSAVLNALLSMLNERVVFDAQTGKAIPVKAWVFIGTSNKPPEEDELQALYDRFPIRVFTRWLEDDEKVENALKAVWTQQQELRPIASMDDVRVLNEFAIQLLRTVGFKELGGNLIDIYYERGVPLVQALRAKGVPISDRTLISKLPKIYASYIILDGLSPNGINFGAVAYGIHEVLPLLARRAEDVLVIKNAINEALGEIGKLREELERAKGLIMSKTVENITEAKKILEEILRNTNVNKMAKDDFTRAETEAIVREARELYQRILRWEGTAIIA